MKRKYSSLFIPLLFSALMTCGCGGGGSSTVAPATPVPHVLTEQEALFVEAYKLMDANFLYADRIPQNYDGLDDSVLGPRLVEDYHDLDAFMASFDDEHTEYLTPEEYSNISISPPGAFGGVGIVIKSINHAVTVYDVFEGTPAEAAGVLPDDLIVNVDGVSTEGLNVDQVSAVIRGEPGTVVMLTITRPGVFSDRDFPITREVIQTPIVSGEKLDSGIGYISMKTFSASTVDQFDDVYETLNGDGINGLVLDLRSNPGGSLGAAVEVASRFFEYKKVCSSQDKDGNLLTYYSSYYNAIVTHSTVVLVNEKTASAAEVLAAALRESGGSELLGTPTFGNDGLRTLYQLSNGGSAIITTRRYLTPDGNSYTGTGLSPDHYVAQSEEDTSIGVDTQLESAVNLLLSFSSAGRGLSGRRSLLRVNS